MQLLPKCVWKVSQDESKQNDIFAEIDVIVSSDLWDELLLGVNELKTLKVLPPNFPHDIVRQVTSFETMKWKLIEAFPETLSDELSPHPMNTTHGLMHINMKVSVTPHHEVVARRIPLRFKDQSDKVIYNLIEKNVIVKVDILGRG